MKALKVLLARLFGKEKKQPRYRMRTDRSLKPSEVLQERIIAQEWNASDLEQDAASLQSQSEDCAKRAAAIRKELVDLRVTAERLEQEGR